VARLQTPHVPVRSLYSRLVPLGFRHHCARLLLFGIPVLTSCSDEVASIWTGTKVVIFVVIGIVIASVVLAAVSHILSSARKLMYLPLQRANENKATKVLANLQDKVKHEKYFVYLRSFRTDRLSTDWGGVWSHNLRDSVPRMINQTLDEYLHFSLQSEFGLLICVGAKGFEFGAARVSSTDETWRDDVATLLKSSSLIILTPWPTKGALEELQMVYSNASLRKKTVLLMPPDHAGLNIKAYWNRLLKAAEKLNISLPAYDIDGAAFMLDGGSVSLSSAFSAEAVRRLLRQ